MGQVIGKIKSALISEIAWDCIKFIVTPGLVAMVTTISAIKDSFLGSLPWPFFISVFLASFILVWHTINIFFTSWSNYTNKRNAVGPSGKVIEFFKDRTELENRQPIPEIFKEGNEIHGYFLTGEGLFSPHNNNMKYVKRLILPNPNGSYLKRLTKLQPNKYLNVPEQIKITSYLAKQEKKVKWFDDYIGMGILICNPYQSDGWMHIEFFVPYLNQWSKPAIRIEKNSHPDVFKGILEAFDSMWDASEKPGKVIIQEQAGDQSEIIRVTSPEIEKVVGYRYYVQSISDKWNDGDTPSQGDFSKIAVDYEHYVHPVLNKIKMREPGEIDWHGVIFKFENPIELAIKEHGFGSVNQAITFLDQLIGRLQHHHHGAANS